MRRFIQVDVFAGERLRGNPLAVVIDGDGLDDHQMQRFANWTNLSETTFICSATRPDADYRLRIFTPTRELDFAGHPTLGSCHAWLEAGGHANGREVVQECGVGLVTIRRGERLAFAAPPPRRTEPLDPVTLTEVCACVGVDARSIVGHRLLDNGPTFHALLLADAAAVLAVRPDLAAMGDRLIAVAGRTSGGDDADLEVRMFAPGVGVPEDPVTGSLNAILAQWLIGAGVMPHGYVASQGTALGRAGRVHVETHDGQVWVGGETITCIRGTVDI